MNVDTELDTWRRQWQSEPAIPPDLRARVERQSRWMRIMLAGDILVTVIIGGATGGWAITTPQPDIVTLAVATWIFIAAAWAFGLHSRRGNWSPSAIDTASFVDLSIRRARASLVAVRFGALLYLIEIAFCVGWIYQHAGQPRPPLAGWIFGSTTMDLVWILTAVFFVFLLRFRNKKRAELDYLLHLRKQQSLLALAREGE